MTPTDPAEAIALALARLRGQRRDPHQHPHHHHHGPHQHFGPHGAGASIQRRGPARMRMLEVLAAASEPLSVSEIGEAIGVDQPRASRLVQQGVELGLVVRELDPDDARRTRIALTEQGRQLARTIRGERRARVEEALAPFTESERTELARLLKKLADNWRG